MNDNTINLGADLLVIPDGVEGDKLHISIRVTPSQVGAGNIALDQWPAEIARLSKRIRIRIVTSDNGNVNEVAPVVTKSGLADFFAPDQQWNGKSRREAASAMWQEIFQPVGFDNLRDSIEGMGKENPESPLQIFSSRTADHQIFLDKLIAWHDAATPQSRKAASVKLKSVASRVKEWIKLPHKAETEQAQDEQDSPMQARAEQLKRLLSEIDQLLSLGSDVNSENKGNESQNAPELKEITSLFSEHWFVLFGKDTLPPPPKIESPPKENWGETKIEGAGRKLSALLSLPTLSHYLGLAVQVVIPLASLEGHSKGQMAAEFVDDQENYTSGKTSWTAFEIVGDHFGPAPNPDAKCNDKLYCSGYLNLGARLTPLQLPRFILHSQNVVEMVQDFLRMAENDEDSHLKHHRRGLVLYDLANKPCLMETEQRARKELASNHNDKINYLDDLVTGYRPDFAIAPREAQKLDLSEDRWRSVTARSIRCKHAEFDDKNFYEHETIKRIAHRDHGYTTALVKVLDKTGDTLAREDEMFSWSGESLGVHAPRKDETDVQPDHQYDLALDLTYELPSPDNSMLKMPPLREKVRYACGCRLVYVNGAGPEFESARKFYADNSSIVIGDSEGRPLEFPAAPMAAPDVHLGWNDPLVKTDDPLNENPGESSQALVIRDGNGYVRRFVTPPRVSFDSAEQQKQFDKSKDKSPHGALDGRRGLWLFGEEGKFPEARFGESMGGIRYLDGNTLKAVPIYGSNRNGIDIGSDDYKKIPYPQSRGTVAILGERREPANDKAPFYPDANGRELFAQLFRASLDYPKESEPLTEIKSRYFWGANQQPADAIPIVIGLKPGEEKVSFSNKDSTKLLNVDVNDDGDSVGNFVELPYLEVLVPIGETSLLKLKGDTTRSDTGVIEIKCVHAVKQPLRAPSFIPKETPDNWKCSETDLQVNCRRKGVGLRAITTTVKSDAPDNPTTLSNIETWTEKVNRLEATGCDMRCWPSEEGGTTTFFTGRVDLDRKTTGSLRCEAMWEESNEGTVSRTNDGRWVKNIAKETAQLFKFEVEHRGNETRLDLLRAADNIDSSSPAGELRSLSYAFRDGRARELKVKMVATSAFTNYYNTDTAETSTGILRNSEFDRESNSLDNNAPSIWTDCTFRPPPVKVDRVLPLFEWGKVPGKRTSTRRVAHLRIYLDEGWYASGAGEQLGVVLLCDNKLQPENGCDQLPKKVCDYLEEPFKSYHRFLSQVGSDPARVTKSTPLILEPRHFPNTLPPVRASLFVNDGGDKPDVEGDGQQEPSSLPVTVIPFEPTFTKEDGLFCDLQVDVGESYFPFLRLGLVRYQKHAVEHLRLSHPIAFDVQLLPERRVWVEIPENRKDCKVVFEGPGFIFGNQGDANRRNNALRLALYSKQWLHIREVRVIVERLEMKEKDNDSFLYHCEHQFDLSNYRVNKDVWLLVEEYERMPLDNPTHTYADGVKIFSETAGERLVFSCTLLVNGLSLSDEK